MASSSSDRASSGVVLNVDPVQAAVVAAKQLNCIWRTRPYLKLLQRPPPAVWSGKAAEAVRRSKDLLGVVSQQTEDVAAGDCASSIDQLLCGLEQQQFASLVAQLAVWLQQLPEVTTELAAGSSSSSSSSSQGDALDLWRSCHACMLRMASCLTMYMDRQPDSAIPHVEHLASSFDSAGATYDQARLGGSSTTGSSNR
jgi:hypothetical protein